MESLPAVEFDLATARGQREIEAPMVNEWRLSRGTAWARIHRLAQGFLLRFPDLADFEVSEDGANVRSWPAPGIAHDTVEHLYLNQVLPLALSRRGCLVFHASAVEIDGGAVAFMGESGRGKSTLAASFATRGHPFLTDDGLYVETRAGDALVRPGHPSLRLWEDSEAALIEAGASRAPHTGLNDKARFLSGEALAHCGSARPLRRVYFLGDGACASPRVAALSRAEAFNALVKHSFVLGAGEPRMLESHFDGLASLAGDASFRALDFPRRFECLADVRAAVLADLAREG